MTDKLDDEHIKDIILKKYIGEDVQLQVGRVLKNVNASTILTRNCIINSQNLQEIEYRISEVEGATIRDSKIKVVFKLPYIPTWLDEEFIKLYQTSNGHYLHPGYKMTYNIKITKKATLESLDSENKLNNSEKLFAIMYFSNDLEFLKFTHNKCMRTSKIKKNITNSANCDISISASEVKYHYDGGVDAATMIKRLYKNYKNNIKTITGNGTLSFLTYNIFRPDKITDGLSEIVLLHHIHNNKYINIMKNPLNREFYYRLYIYSKMKRMDALKYINVGGDGGGDFRAFFRSDDFKKNYEDYYKNYKNYDFVRSHFENRFFYFGDVVNIKSDKSAIQNVSEVAQYITNLTIDDINNELVDLNNTFSPVRDKHQDKVFRLLGDYIYSFNEIRGEIEKYFVSSSANKSNYSKFELDDYYLMDNPHIAIMLHNIRVANLPPEGMNRLINLFSKNSFMDSRYWMRHHNYSPDYIAFLMIKYDVPVGSYSQVFNKLSELYGKSDLTDTKLHVFFTNYDSQMPIEWSLELNSNKRKTDKS